MESSIYLPKHMSKNVCYNHTVHKIQNLEITEIPINSRMDTFLYSIAVFEFTTLTMSHLLLPVIEQMNLRNMRSKSP